MHTYITQIHNIEKEVMGNKVLQNIFLHKQHIWKMHQIGILKKHLHMETLPEKPLNTLNNPIPLA